MTPEPSERDAIPNAALAPTDLPPPPRRRTHPWKGSTGGFTDPHCSTPLPDRRFRMLPR